MDSQNEKMLKDYPRPIFIKETKIILQQMVKSVCEICTKDGSKGSGFFCKIPLLNNTFIHAFITNNHVINEKYLKEENEIKIKMNDGYKTDIKAINIKNRLYYTNEEQDGSSGSPILNLSNNKVVGIHKKRGTTKYNIGLFVYESIKNFITKYESEKNKKLNIPKITSDKNKELKMNEFISNNKNKKLDKLFDIFKNLSEKKLISDIVPIKKEEEKYLAYQLICKSKFLSSKKYESWIPAWHGTGYDKLESIIKYGLKLPKSKLENGKFSPAPKVIPKYSKVDGINNWENAIFASPCIWGATRYSEPLFIEEECAIRERYYCLIEVLIRPNSYTEHEKKDLDDIFEVCCGNYEDYEKGKKKFKIYRISCEENIIVKSILFIINCFSSQFIEKKYEEQKQILKKNGFLDNL